MPDSCPQKFEHKGYKFELDIERDEDMGLPWEEHDGHGIVSDWRSSAHTGNFTKAPGERILTIDRHSYRTYDFKATLERAAKEGWGLGINDEAELARRLGRMPTPREIVVEAVERDYRRMKAWCNDEWYWVIAIVYLLDINGNRTSHNAALGGIESDDEGYIERDVMRELADQLIDDIDEATELVERTVLKREEACASS